MKQSALSAVCRSQLWVLIRWRGEKRKKTKTKPIYIHEINCTMSSNDTFLLSAPVWNSDRHVSAYESMYIM